MALDATKIMNTLSIKILLFINTFFLTTFLLGQKTELSPQINPNLSQFEAYKRFDGRPFTLHKDLVTENLAPVSSGIFYSIYDKEYLSAIPEGDSITPWEGAVCYFPKEIWGNTAAKVKYAQDDNNWLKITFYLNGDFLSSSYYCRGVEMSELNELFGVWYLYNRVDSSRDGMWCNEEKDNINSKSKIYYIKFK